MLSKKEIKDIQSLRHKKGRSESSHFVAEGPKIINELLQVKKEIFEKIYALPVWVEQQQEQTTGISVETVNETELERLSSLQTPNTVIALLKQLPSVKPVVRNKIVLYLDAIRDPGNLGTIIRIADWFGISDIVCSPDCADVYNPKVVQSTMASIARVNTWYDENNDWLSEQKVPLIGATLDGRSVYESKPQSPFVLLIGNEANGLSDKALSVLSSRISIPRYGEAESLNAAVATGILLSHLVNENG